MVQDSVALVWHLESGDWELLTRLVRTLAPPEPPASFATVATVVVNLKAAVWLSTDFTDFTDGLAQEASPLRSFHFTRRVKRQPFPTCFKSVESVQSVDPTAFSKVKILTSPPRCSLCPLW